MRMLKRTACWLLAWVMVLGLLPTAAMAAGSVMLAATLSSGRSVTFYPDSTIADVKAALGEPKIETVSRYGGNAYSFYGDGYRDYFYFETKADGRIALYSVVGCDFRSAAGDFGEERRGGTLVTYCYQSRSSQAICAVAALNEDYATMTWDEISAARTGAAAAYQDDAQYAEGISQHAAAMWNAVNAYFGRSSDLGFDSRTFYMNRQLMENGGNLCDHLTKTGRREAIDFITYGSGGGDPRYHYFNPNPLTFAAYARNYLLPDESYIVFDVYRGSIIVAALRRSYFETGSDVPLTAEEQARLERMKALYAESTAQWNQAGSYYTRQPQDTQTPLDQGAVDPDRIQAAVKFLNAVRVGAGLNELTYSPELSDGAQCKAALTTYLKKAGISNPSPHHPPQPAGVSGAYYQKAQDDHGENLFNGNVLTSIINALDDGMGDPVSCGHRYNLLDPRFTEVGLGDSGGQSVHKFKFGSALSPNVDTVCWPSKGVMMSQATSGGSNDMYTVRFYNGYTLTEDSGVVFHCLNTGETFQFSGDMGETDARGLTQASSSQISYHDKNISLSPGSVYEITVTNVKDAAGALTDYKYRSVYASVYSVPDSDTTLTLSDSSLSIQEGERRKINASILPEDTANKLVTWSSDDESVASVTGNGIVTGRAVGTAEITARMENGIAARCAVSVREADPVRLGAGGVSTASGKISFTAAVDNSVVSAVSGTLYAAAYRDGRLSAVQSLPVQLPAGGRTEQAFSLSGQTAKLFFLDSRTLLPLTVPKEVG